MIILGLHYGHNGAACLVRDGQILAAIASERITRAKKSGGVTDEVLDYLFGACGVTVKDIDAVALTDWYHPWSHGTLNVYSLDERYTSPTSQPLAIGDWVHDSWDRIWGGETWRCEVELRGRRIPGYNVAHHLAHCASAYYTSPYQDAWCMSMDSSGAKPGNNFLIARGMGKYLEAVPSEFCMVGFAYGHTCNNLAIGEQLHKAGSMMALAGYGTVNPHIWDRREHLARQPFFPQNGDYLKWQRQLWCDLSGGREFTRETSDSTEAADIAASMQFIFEESIVHAVNERIPDDGCTNLCLSGGSFLNCNANTRVRTETRFANVHHFPACTDDGLAVGSALYVAHNQFRKRRKAYEPADVAYLGPKQKGTEPDYKRVAQAIANGAVVAWFNGRSEYGPRALGNRSMLADPRVAENRERINHEIKKREWFRPLAPSVLAEKSHEWFDFPGESPFMLYTARCLQPERVPAIMHIDGTARMQTVQETDNPRYYRLIKAFDEITGVPMLLNTSLNVDGQPILETEAHALEFWERGIVDMMVLNGRIYER